MAGRDRKPSKVWLMLTNRCNISCVYCYNTRRDGPDMTWDTLLRAMDFIFEHTKPDAEIMLWGGEPLFAWDMIKRLLDYYPNQRFGMSTNGTLITQEIIGYLKQRGNFVTVLSLDGNKESQEKSRPGAWNMLKNVRLFTQLEDVSVHLVAYDVRSLYENVNSVCGLGFKSIFLTPAHGVEYSEEEKQIYEDELHKIARDWKAGRFEMLGWKDFQYPGLKSKDKFCGAGVTMFAISTMGNIYPCDAFYGIDRYKMGSIYSGFDLSVKRQFEDIFYNRVNCFAGCFDCVYEGGCGGRMCIQQNLLKNGSLLKPITDTCDMLRIEKKVVEGYLPKPVYQETYLGDLSANQ